MDRYKEANPADTVKNVKALLASVGLHMEGTVENCGGKLFSVRISDGVTGFSTNGKGASEELCLASAYGEAMERLQNHYGFTGFHDPEVNAYRGFVRSPEETFQDFDETLEQFPFIREDMDLSHEDSGQVVLDYWKGRLGNRLVMLPYYNVGQDSTVYLPDQLISELAGSNGLCAGNTPQEALCEGMHELCERYAKALILSGDYCPPDIPRAFIEQNCPEQAEMIRMVEELFPGHHIIVKDASLGQGIPVVCLIIIDRKRGAYHIKFGSHLRFSIALERCLTELFQGYVPSRKQDMLNALTVWSETSRASVDLPENHIGLETSDVGAIPDRILLDNSSWEFAPWGLEDFDNTSGLRTLTDLLASIGGDVFIRDASYLGFPAYRVYVPKVSARFALHGARKDRCTFMEATFERNVCRAILAYERGDLAMAAEYLRKTDKRHHLCAAQELRLRMEGRPEHERDQLLKQFFGSAAARHATTCWRSTDVVAALTQQRREAVSIFGSPENEHTPRHIFTGSRYEATAVLKRKLKDHMAQHPIDQQELSKLYR